jgi:hypothetical protein
LKPSRAVSKAMGQQLDLTGTGVPTELKSLLHCRMELRVCSGCSVV